MGLNVEGANSFTSILCDGTLNGVDLNNFPIDKFVTKSGVTLWERLLANTSILTDFNYTQLGHNAGITGWKGTLNGVASTSCVVPEGEHVELYNINFSKYPTMTSISIPSNTKITNGSLYCAFEGLTNLKTANVVIPVVTNISFLYNNCRNLTGSPICWDNVIEMAGTYRNCQNLTGSPVC